jgi:hypothetical protein
MMRLSEGQKLVNFTAVAKEEDEELEDNLETVENIVENVEDSTDNIENLVENVEDSTENASDEE